MSETTSETTRRRSSVKSGDTSSDDEGKVVTTYEDALDAGYIGGPVDEEDHTVAGEIARAKASE